MDGVVYTYYYEGSRLMRMTVGTSITMDFFYDQNGQPFAMKYNSTMLYYVLNAQGDVVRIVNASGGSYGVYKYDAWGNILYTTDNQYLNNNPLRYRGYVYDPDSGMYYCQSRYYDPAIGRFINADALVSTGQGILGNNMFAYCLNNPVNYADDSGYYPLETAFDFLERWLIGDGSDQEFTEQDQVTKKIKKSSQMQSAIDNAIEQYKNGQLPKSGSLHFTPDNGGYELYLGIQHCSYSITVTEETKTTGLWFWKKEKTRYVVTVVVSDIYNFDEIRDWNSVGSIANNIAYIYNLLGGGHDYEWTATFTQTTKWETIP